ncbi:hypothetical protein PybrP1_005141, partial [[Pythium] brassicae (nom. inval.)]
ARGASKSAVGTPTRFLRTPAVGEEPYPYEDERRLAFLRKPTTQILISVVLGTALGALLASLKVSTDVSNLVNIPGRVFLRVLKCFVIPMVFASLSTGVANIVLLGKVSTIGTRTALYFIAFSGAAALISLCVAMMLAGLNKDIEPIAKVVQLTSLNIKCDNDKFLEMTAAETLVCSAPAMGDTTRFELDDLEFALTSSSTTTKISVEDQLAGILNSLFPKNIFAGFLNGVLLSVITFSIAFGAAATRATSRENSPLLDVLNQMNKIFFYIILRVVDWSPLAVFSLVAGSLSGQRAINDAVSHVGVLVLSNFISVVLLELVFYPVVLFLLVRRNPFTYMRAMLPAATFAFGSASSLATLPLSIRCVESTREVSRGLLHFVLTIGSTVHMNGTAMFFPSAVVFLVKTSTTSIDLGWVELFLIWLVSLLGSIGVAPIPNAGLVMIYSIWSTIFPKEDVPITYSYLVAIYWYIDRMNTLCNILGDTFVARIIAEQVDETYEATFHEDGERADEPPKDRDDLSLHHDHGH